MARLNLTRRHQLALPKGVKALWFRATGQYPVMQGTFETEYASLSERPGRVRQIVAPKASKPRRRRGASEQEDVAQVVAALRGASLNRANNAIEP